MAVLNRTKRCSQCKQVKPCDSFAGDRTKLDGLCNICKACKYVYKQEWQKRNRPKANEYKRKYLAENWERINSEARKASEERRELRRLRRAEREKQKQAERELECRRTCSRCSCSFQSSWPRRNCDECRRILKLAYKAGARKRETPEQAQRRRANTRKRYEIRYRSDVKYQVCQRFRVALRRTVTDKGGRSAFKMLGYTPAALIRRLKQTMPDGYTWDDVLSGKLHIDHIDPVAAFNFSSVDDPDFHRCWSLTNLRLLPAEDNLRKGDRLIRPFHPMLFPRRHGASSTAM